MITVFALANGRSGTRFLCHLLRNNLKNAVCRHEPYFDWGNPSMFGQPIYYHAHGKLEPIRKLLVRKQKFIASRRSDTYVETSHSFLKSYYDLAEEFFPQSKYVHLIRHPLKTARSETNRELWVDSTRFPWRHYRTENGRKLFCWSLTGDEPIYQAVGLPQPTLFQHYVIQWIEVENRAMQFLDQFDNHNDCTTMNSPRDLNDPERVKLMIESLGLELVSDEVQVTGKQNHTPGAKTKITSQEENEFRAVVDRLPDEYLEIFRHSPYAEYDWVTWLQR
ncbi:MAG: hypothetical protein ACR2NU_11380 [Aeoliella sp.]